MKFDPANRHLLVSPIEESEEDKSDMAIVLPVDYEKPMSPYVECRVHAVASDSKFYNCLEIMRDTILVERRMLHKIDIKDETIYLVLDNYVFGRITK